MSMKARAPHFQLKYLLAQMALKDSAEFFKAFGPGSHPDAFAAFWIDFGEQFQPAERVPAEGASVSHYAGEKSGADAVVFAFPTPEANGEAHFVGFFRGRDNHFRIFCLERSGDLPGLEIATMLSELSAQGRANWGGGADPSIDGFLAQVRAIINDPKATPLTFFPLKLV
jgi:hypothetical protein